MPAFCVPFGRVYAAEGPVDFWQKRGYTTSTDRTNAILEHYVIPTMHGQWHEKDDEANAAIVQVPDDTDFVWCLDADEIWKSGDIEIIMSVLDAGNVDSMSFKAYFFLCRI